MAINAASVCCCYEILQRDVTQQHWRMGCKPVMVTHMADRCFCIDNTLPRFIFEQLYWILQSEHMSLVYSVGDVYKDGASM